MAQARSPMQLYLRGEKKVKQGSIALFLLHNKLGLLTIKARAWESTNQVILNLFNWFVCCWIACSLTWWIWYMPSLLPLIGISQLQSLINILGLCWLLHDPTQKDFLTTNEFFFGSQSWQSLWKHRIVIYTWKRCQYDNSTWSTIIMATYLHTT